MTQKVEIISIEKTSLTETKKLLEGRVRIKATVHFEGFENNLILLFFACKNLAEDELGLSLYVQSQARLEMERRKCQDVSNQIS